MDGKALARPHPVTRGLEIVCGMLLLVMVLLLFIQVAARYLLESPPEWTEELARIVFVYATYIGGAVAIARKAHLKVEILPAALPPKVRTALNAVWRIAAIVFLGIVLYQSQLLITRLWHQPLTSLPVSKAVFFAAVPIGCAIMLLYEIADLIANVRALCTGQGN